MRYYAKIDPSGDNHKFLSPPEDSFQIIEVLDGIADFEFLIQNTASNRAIIIDHRSDDFQICRLSDDLVLLTGKIDHRKIQYFSANKASPDRIMLPGQASFIELGDILFRRLSDPIGTEQDADMVYDLDASGPTWTARVNEAKSATASDVDLTFGAVNDAFYIGKNETFSVVKIKYSTKGIQATSTTVVKEYWNGSAWVTLDCLCESREFTKDVGTYFLIVSTKPTDWAKTTPADIAGCPDSEDRYWVRFRITAGSYSTPPELDRLWLADTDILRVQFDNIRAYKIANYILEGTDYALYQYVISDENIGSGDGAEVTFNGNLANVPLVAGTLSITDTVETFSDNGDGTLTGSLGGSGTIDYDTGAYSVTFNTAPGNGQAITADYDYYDCPADIVPGFRAEYESKLRSLAGLANALTWTDVNGDKHAYDFSIDVNKKVHIVQQRGSSKGDISADLTMLDNAEDYQGIGNRIFGLGSFDGINQRRAIVENQASQDSHSLREIPLKDLRFSHETSLKELIQKHLTDSKAPLKKVSCEVPTEYWLDNSLAVGDEVTIDQPDWNVSAQTYRIMRAVIDPSRTTLDLGVVQVHLENIRDVLQRQINISDVFMQGCTTAFSLPSFAQNIEKTAADNFYSYMQFKIPKNCKYVNSASLFWYLDNFRAPSKVTSGGSAHRHSVAGVTMSSKAAHSHGFGAAETTDAADATNFVTGALMTATEYDYYSLRSHYHSVPAHKHTILCPYYAGANKICPRGAAGSKMTIGTDWASVGAGGYIETEDKASFYTGAAIISIPSPDDYSVLGYLPTGVTMGFNLTKQTHTHTLIGTTTDSDAAHSHTISVGQVTAYEEGSAHTHTIEFGVQEEAAPASVIAVDIKIAGGWNALPDSPYTGDESEVDIRDVVGQNISGGEIIQIRFLPNATGRCWIRGGGDFQGFIESK